MNYRRKRGQLDLTERLAIETGLCRGETFKKSAMHEMSLIQFTMEAVERKCEDLGIDQVKSITIVAEQRQKSEEYGSAIIRFRMFVFCSMKRRVRR